MLGCSIIKISNDVERINSITRNEKHGIELSIQWTRAVKDEAQMSGGLDLIIETLEMRYEYDERGRILRLQPGSCLPGFPPGSLFDSESDSLPLFVLGRAAEGCVWRFSARLSNDRVVAVARLAAREPGLLIQAGTTPPQPERLVMIERLLAPDVADAGTDHEVLTKEGSSLAELWTIAWLGRGAGPVISL
jgi:hypothetical protein